VNVIQVSVGWTETASLPNYNNIKPSVTLTATLEEGDNPTGCVSLLMEQAQREVRDLINQADEEHNNSPRYYKGPLFILLQGRERECYVIAPKGGDYPADLRKITIEGPLNFVNSRAGDYAADYGYQVINCADGDFSKLPKLPEPDRLDKMISTQEDPDDDPPDFEDTEDVEF
jgi:hypothetical protein